MNQQQPQYRCRECGNDSCTVQLREVLVKIGWQYSAFQCVSPCLMCTRCGDRSVHYDITIGKFVDLVPADRPPQDRPPGQPMIQPQVEQEAAEETPQEPLPKPTPLHGRTQTG